MPRKSKDSKPRSRRWRPVVAVLLTLAVVCGIFFAFDRLGEEALHRIGLRERYRVAFIDVQCDVPPELDRHNFLTEVRYVSKFPDSLNALDEFDREHLSRAFGTHPWVEAVEGVSVEAGNAVKVKLKFRVPILAVHLEGGAVRLVDVHGVLLPEVESPKGIAELTNLVPAPNVVAGQVWPDDTVKRAVDLVNAYRPKQLERTATEWRLVLPDGKTLTAAK